MALLFSAVTVTADSNEEEFIIGGIPREKEDLEGWSLFEEFLDGVDDGTSVEVKAEVYLYGRGEADAATPEDVAYIMLCLGNDECFLQEYCDNIEDVRFEFTQSADEEYEMEL